MYFFRLCYKNELKKKKKFTYEWSKEIKPKKVLLEGRRVGRSLLGLVVINKGVKWKQILIKIYIFLLVRLM